MPFLRSLREKVLAAGGDAVDTFAVGKCFACLQVTLSWWYLMWVCPVFLILFDAGGGCSGQHHELLICSQQLRESDICVCLASSRFGI
jgi:hypothetical protein